MMCFFQAIFDRNRKDELPSLQLEWIDGICAPLYEVFMSNKAPLFDSFSNEIADEPRYTKPTRKGHFY